MVNINGSQDRISRVSTAQCDLNKASGNYSLLLFLGHCSILCLKVTLKDGLVKQHDLGCMTATPLSISTPLFS